MHSHKKTHIFCARILGFLCSMLAAAPAIASTSERIVRPQITILERLTPAGGAGTLVATTATAGGLPIFTYFLASKAFIYGAAVGFCVLWTLIGGIFIMISGDNQANREKGIGMMKSSIMGLVILIFAGSILNALNSVFFV